MKQLKQNIATCIEHGDLSDRAKILWTYLAATRPRGLGKTKLAENLGWEVDDVAAVGDELKRADLLEVTAGKLVARPFMLPPDPEEAEPVPTNTVVTDMLAEYNRRREAHGLPKTWLFSKKLRKMAELAERLNERNAQFTHYLDFAERRGEFAEVQYIPLDMLVGDWMWEQFVAAGGRIPRRARERQDIETVEVAKLDPVSLRERLVSAGINTAKVLTKADLRHIQSWACLMAEEPENYPEPDERFAPEINWVYEQITSV